MNLAPVTIEREERFDKLTVLAKVKNYRGKTLYRCGCVCGFSATFLTARKLMSGKVKACRKCTEGA
jgi:hypothetical protein